MPKTSSGKLRRRACRSAFGDGSLDEVARWTAIPAADRISSIRPTPSLPRFKRAPVELVTGT
jgi:hypothetical protein